MIELRDLDDGDFERLKAALRRLPSGLRLAEVDWATVLSALQSGVVPPTDASTATVADLVAELDQLAEHKGRATIAEFERRLAAIRRNTFGRDADEIIEREWAALTPREQRSRIAESEAAWSAALRYIDERQAALAAIPDPRMEEKR